MEVCKLTENTLRPNTKSRFFDKSLKKHLVRELKMTEIQNGHKFLAIPDKSIFNESTSEIQIPGHSLETRHLAFLYKDLPLKLPSKVEKMDGRVKKILSP